MRLEVADHEIDALVRREPRIAEHLVGLAHARGRAQVDAQLAAPASGDVHEASLESDTGIDRRACGKGGIEALRRSDGIDATLV